MIRFILLILCVLLTGCVGDRLEFRNKGDALIDKNSICVKAKSGDVLTYYLLSSSTDNYEKPLEVGTGVNMKYPNICIFTVLKNNTDYDLIYVLNGGKYRIEFSIDGKGVISEGYRGLQ
ncbi:putative T6SS immunity periplasmic lipoprotein [Yersinia thracica]|uniref:putative T6SS immunity periplasmic lipoprotein n=1 Tax=Yersinia thracica TaxID=2890319 RepID=UPI0039A2946B